MNYHEPPLITMNVGKTINHPPVIFIFIGGMFTIPSHGWFMALCLPTWCIFRPEIYLFFISSWKVTENPLVMNKNVTGDHEGNLQNFQFFSLATSKKIPSSVGHSTMKTSSNYHPGKTYLSFWDWDYYNDYWDCYYYNDGITIMITIWDDYNDGHFKRSFCTSRNSTEKRRVRWFGILFEVRDR